MLTIFYNKNTLQDTLVINVNKTLTIKVDQHDDFVYGLDKDNEITFINVFHLSNYVSLPEGYLHLDEQIQNLILKNLNTDLKKYNTTLPLIVGKVIRCEPIDDTHLHICQVDIGKETLPIVCGASNIKNNMKVVVAQIGAIIPNGLTINRGKLMNYESVGMICSAKELNLHKHTFNSEGIIELPDYFTVGQNFMYAFANYVPNK
jgi:tRNA-binding protein